MTYCARSAKACQVHRVLRYRSRQLYQSRAGTSLRFSVCNAEHYGDHAVAEHTFALLFELIRKVGQLDKDVKAGTGMGRRRRFASLPAAWVLSGGIGATVAGIARASAWKLPRGIHVPAEHFERSERSSRRSQ